MNVLPAELVIYKGVQRVGVLRVSAGVYQLDYSPEWMAVQGARGLSLRLPSELSHYEGKEVEYFFDNLLPEERVRRTLAKKHGVSAENVFALLCIIGRECAGAFSLLPSGEAPIPPGEAKGSYRPLGADEMAGLLEQLPVNPMLSGVERVSLSLAGAQNKICLLRRGRRFYLPRDGVPSNCILKPVLPLFSDSVANELFCLRLARKAGLNAVGVSAVFLRGKPVLCVDRYDRVSNGMSVERLHQEDFCQVLGLPHGAKYEREGGPSFGDCAHAIRRYSVAAASDILQLCHWAVFNMCIGNADAHAKNLSFLHTGDGTRLAPFYDLLSTTLYEYFDDRSAMAMGGASMLEDLNRGAWEAFAGDLGLPPTAVLRMGGLVCTRMIARMETVAYSLLQEGFPEWQVEGLARHITRRIGIVQQSLVR